MLDNSTIETLKAMHCSAMALELENQLSDSKTYSTLSFEERMALIVDAEWNRRQKNKLHKLIKTATFSQPTACIENIEYLPDRKLDKAQLLRFATCQYISDLDFRKKFQEVGVRIHHIRIIRFALADCCIDRDCMLFLRVILAVVGVVDIRRAFDRLTSNATFVRDIHFVVQVHGRLLSAWFRELINSLIFYHTHLGLARKTRGFPLFSNVSERYSPSESGSRVNLLGS